MLNLLKGKQNVIQMLDFFYSIDNHQRIIQCIELEYCDQSLENLL
jgi:hypothetical protein